jgi:hypothetical protein
MGEMSIQMNKEKKIGFTSSFKGYSRYTKKSGNNWRKFKHNIKMDMTNTRLIVNSKLETRYGFTSTRID